MQRLSRRALLKGATATTGLWALTGCATTPVVRRDVDPRFRPQQVAFASTERKGTIVINPAEHFLYRVEGDGRAMRYGVAVGGEGFGWSGVAAVHSKQEWPDWYPTAGILERHPQLRPAMRPLPSGVGMAGGPDNPLGARALYLWQNNKDTLYRIHGTNEPWSIGTNVSSGCIRLVNDDAIALYDRTPVGTKVVVLPSAVS